MEVFGRKRGQVEMKKKIEMAFGGQITSKQICQVGNLLSSSKLKVALQSLSLRSIFLSETTSLSCSLNQILA